MADDHDPHNASDISDQNDVAPAKEDAETAATRKELKHTALSENPTRDLDSDASSNDKTPPRSRTPDDAHTDLLKEEVGSPRRKRAHEELDDHKDDDGDVKLVEGEFSQPANGNRTTRTEPEKKRHREDSVISIMGSEAKEATGDDDAKSKDRRDSKATSEEVTATAKSKTEPAKGKPSTSTDAFKNSTFGALANSPSPFAAAGATKSMFSGGTSSVSPFGQSSAAGRLSGFATPASKPAEQPVLSFKSAASAPSAFNSNGSATGGFGRGFGGFSSASGPRLTSFGNPSGGVLKSQQPAKPFGAPASEDEESDSDRSGDEGDDPEDDAKTKEKEGSQPPVASEDKKKPKLHKVQVDDGEAGEVTLLSVRCKMYIMGKTEKKWKERGGGMLKINVPRECIDFDETNAPILGTFDASTLEDSEGSDQAGAKGPRLVMRQDATMRVILNAAIVSGMEFKKNDGLKATGIIFTAHLDTGAETIQVKLSPANAKTFMQEVKSIQRELGGGS